MAINQSQQPEISRMVKSQVRTWSLITLALLGGIAGIGMMLIDDHMAAQTEKLVSQQLSEPAIKKVFQEAASERAVKVMSENVQPEVELFRTNAAHRLSEVNDLTEKTKKLELESAGTRDRIVGVQSDLIKMQKCMAKIQYLIAKGQNQNPNPYQAQITSTLNELLTIAIPDKAERLEFIRELDENK